MQTRHGHVKKHLTASSRARQLVSAFSCGSFAAQGIKVGDLQATAQGFLSAYMFFVISNGKPLEKLSQERPHPSIFCAYVFLSVIGQFTLHLAFLIYMYYSALGLMPAVRTCFCTAWKENRSPDRL